MTVVDVVDMIVVGNRHMTTGLTVRMAVIGVLVVSLVGALVDMVSVDDVDVAVMDVVGVVAVGEGDVPAALAVSVGMAGMLGVGGGHECSSSECRMASLTIWPTWASTSW